VWGIALAMSASSCGRLGFEIPADGGDDSIDVGLRDSAIAFDAGLDARAPLDVGIDARTPRDVGTDASCSTSGTDYCNEVPRLGADPVLDGTLECGLTLAPLTPGGWSGSAPIPAGVTARYAVAWRPTGLYFFVSVTSRTYSPVLNAGSIHCGDAVELNVDSDGMYPSSPAYDHPGNVLFIAAAPPSASTTERFGFARQTTPSPTTWTTEIAVPTPDGYVVEAFVDAAAMQVPGWSLSAGAHFGFDVVVNLSGTPQDGAGCPASTPRRGQFALRVTAARTGCDGFPFCDVRAFCNPIAAD